MSFVINAFNHREWRCRGLAEYEDFADMVTECNVGEDAFSGYGEWFYIPDQRLPGNQAVVYFGSWGNDHGPGASMYTNAALFDMDDPDDSAEFARTVARWQRQPEWIGENDQ